MKRFTALLSFFILISACQEKKVKTNKPKLVIGIVVDQMRYDYLNRFSDRYGENGFKKLIKNGFSLENAHYSYIPTYTAVGHASIFTGTTPNNHGVISNNWYDKFLKKSIYCVTDESYITIGNQTDAGKRSPKRLFTSTISDQLNLAQNKKGKTIGIAIKDRSAILPIGHSADAAYWFQGYDQGQWISSSFYMNKLPEWVSNFNNSKIADQYLTSNWNTLYNIDTYTNSINDDNIFENLFVGESTSTFPHNIPELRKDNGNFNILKAIPAGNTFTFDFAKAAIENEKLGEKDAIDFLTVSFSSTDYIGHHFGPSSVEIEDTYLRFDKDLGEFLSFLDSKVGEDNYTLFLTADHAAVNIPSFLQSQKIPAHYLDIIKFKSFLLGITKKYFKTIDIIENVSNYQIFLKKEKVESLGLNVNEVAEKIADEVVNFNGIYKAVSAKTLQTSNFTTGILNSLQNGYNQKFSGDVMMIPYPATLISGRKGTSHGSGYSYDTHVPVIFYGKGIKKGSSKKRYNIIDIAPTISNLLNIEAPNSTTGKIIEEALK
jgi:predicted AlkP superfamily pyrophosphatase or phosphodiesterase